MLERYVLERGQVFEQGVAGARHQHLVSWIAQELEGKGVGFAGARREDHAVSCDGDTPLGESARHFRPRGGQTEGFRRVFESAGLGERGENLRRGVRKLGARRVREREVEHLLAARAARRKRERKRVRAGIVSAPPGKHVVARSVANWTQLSEL